MKIYVVSAVSYTDFEPLKAFDGPAKAADYVNSGEANKHPDAWFTSSFTTNEIELEGGTLPMTVVREGKTEHTTGDELEGSDGPVCSTCGGPLEPGDMEESHEDGEGGYLCKDCLEQ